MSVFCVFVSGERVWRGWSLSVYECLFPDLNRGELKVVGDVLHGPVTEQRGEVGPGRKTEKYENYSAGCSAI